jgi:DNA repair photolyase
MDMTVSAMPCKTALHYHNSKWLPFKYDINVYRGCAHRCIYCYALYSHAYISGGSFYSEIYAKTNIAAVLQTELRRFSGETVNLGGVTDSYQPAERDFKLMPRVLELLAAHRVPVTLSTKSPLILRDIEPIKRVNAAAGFKAAFTVTTMNPVVASLLEPGAPPPQRRMDAVRTLRQEGISCGVHMMPIIPFLTSGRSDMEAVFHAAKQAGASYILAGALNLKGQTRKSFFDSMRQTFPSEYGRIRALYGDKYAYRAYKDELQKTLRELREKYVLSYWEETPTRHQPKQLSFFGGHDNV